MQSEEEEGGRKRERKGRFAVFLIEKVYVYVYICVCACVFVEELVGDNKKIVRTR